MEITFLGTGSAYPSPTRAASCTAFRHGVWITRFTVYYQSEQPENRASGVIRPSGIEEKWEVDTTVRGGKHPNEGEGRLIEPDFNGVYSL
ncbi:hypothetical protein KUTeg_015407 [Tegillarca granosa]|uniref:Uncharacterized protein n=1 Tax=Tegillarca granosa TaxID=220873 RepID=A0ABQ9EQ24_TEGGR|nr:hypothetical protein KUTeg_015407 [Tegillarca granosa]